MKLVLTNDSVYQYASKAPSAVGGAERQQWLLARALAKAGWSVTVGVGQGLERGMRDTVDGVEFAGIGRGHNHILSSWYWFLRSERPDWWYWRGVDHKLGLAVEVAKFLRVNTIYSTAFDSDVHPRRALTRRTHWWRLYAWGLSRADRIFLQHGGQFSELPIQWRSKASIVPSIAGIAAGPEGCCNHDDYVAWVGMLRQPKRPDLLVEIARKLPRVRFVVCGAPHDHRSPAGYGERILADLRRLPNVDFLGQTAAEKAQRVIGQAAMLLLTSDGEGFPNTLLQAWSSGTPVISLTIDPDHCIDRLRLGSVAGSVEGAVADIQALMKSPAQRMEIAARAHNYVESAHSENAAVAAFESAIGRPGIRGV